MEIDYAIGLMNVIITSLFFVLGYKFFLELTHPEKKKHKLPPIKLGNLEILPNVRFHFKGKTYHFHHWLLLSIFTLISSYFLYETILNGMYLKSAVAGGIIQGLRYPDRFHFRFPRA